MNNCDKNFTRAKMERHVAQIEKSVARYLNQLDSADRQGPSLARTTKTTRLTEKIAKLKEEMQRLLALLVRMLASPGQQISLTDPDARSMATSRLQADDVFLVRGESIAAMDRAIVEPG